MEIMKLRTTLAVLAYCDISTLGEIFVENFSFFFLVEKFCSFIKENKAENFSLFYFGVQAKVCAFIFGLTTPILLLLNYCYHFFKLKKISIKF
jgi:hypothetical protein